jgi:RNA polymerase sigma-70 factor, ECF subfamily
LETLKPAERLAFVVHDVLVDAFFAAARENDSERLVSVLDADVVLRSDRGGPGASIKIHGAEAVASRAHAYSRVGLVIRPALVNGGPGVVTTRDGKPYSVGAFVVSGGRIVEIDFLADTERLSRLVTTRRDRSGRRTPRWDRRPESTPSRR